MIPYFTIPPLHLFTLPGGRSIDIHAFGVLVACAVLVGIKLQQVRGKQLGLDTVALGSLANHVIAAGFIGAHLFQVLAYSPEKVLRDPTYIFSNFSIASFGGLGGAVIGLALWRRRFPGLNVLEYVDATVFGFVFAWVLGRLGCFTAHDHPGMHTDFFLAVKDYRPLYPGDSSLPRHDLGLYEAIFAAVLATAFGFTAWKLKPRGGIYVSMACLAYPPVRFLLDALRFTKDEMPVELVGPVTQADARYFGMTPAQILSFAMFATGIWLARQWLTGRSPANATS